MYYSYVEIEYVAMSFSPARMDLAVKLLSAMDYRDRPLLNLLRSTVVSCQIFIRSQSLIGRWTRNDFSLPAVACDFYEAC